MRTIVFSCCLLASVVAACGGSDAAAQTDPKKTGAALTGADKAAADKSPECRLFTPAELAKFVGEPLSPGHVAALGTGCQWEGRSEDASAMIQVVPARYHEPHKGAKGFRTLPDVGTRGFVEMSLGGWNAGSITGPQSVVVSVQGPSASDANAIALLKETIKRRGTLH
jgi:hypothetical protein